MSENTTDLELGQRFPRVSGGGRVIPYYRVRQGARPAARPIARAHAARPRTYRRVAQHCPPSRQRAAGATAEIRLFRIFHRKRVIQHERNKIRRNIGANRPRPIPITRLKNYNTNANITVMVAFTHRKTVTGMGVVSLIPTCPPNGCGDEGDGVWRAIGPPKSWPNWRPSADNCGPIR